MKNEDLYVYKKSEFYEDFISSQKEYYEREQVDTLLAEKDREIAMLKERICNGDVSRLTWIDDCIAKDKEIAELKDKLESVQASMYCDVVDANMENRRLKRVLWFSRAKAYWYITELLTCFNPDYIRNRKMFTPNNQKQKQMNSLEWARLMLKVSNKCRAKAEEYK